MKEVEEAVKHIESRLGIHAGFFDALLNEDDWSFVIKSHALIESCAAELITHELGRPELANVFSQLTLGGTEVGKLKILSELGLLNSDEKRFVRAFSKLRNEVVHNVRNVNFTFERYQLSLDRNQKENFVTDFGGLNNKQLLQDVAAKEAFLKSPKSYIWAGLKWLIAIISMQSGVAQSKNYLIGTMLKVKDLQAELDNSKAAHALGGGVKDGPSNN